MSFFWDSQLVNWLCSTVLGFVGGWSLLHGEPVINVIAVSLFFLHYTERKRRELKRLGLERDHFRNCLKERSEKHLAEQVSLESARSQNAELRAELEQTRKATM
jgi:hypothetical protein